MVYLPRPRVLKKTGSFSLKSQRLSIASQLRVGARMALSNHAGMLIGLILCMQLLKLYFQEHNITLHCHRCSLFSYVAGGGAQSLPGAGRYCVTELYHHPAITTMCIPAVCFLSSSSTITVASLGF